MDVLVAMGVLSILFLEYKRRVVID